MNWVFGLQVNRGHNFSKELLGVLKVYLSRKWKSEEGTVIVISSFTRS